MVVREPVRNHGPLQQVHFSTNDNNIHLHDIPVTEILSQLSEIRIKET